MVTITPPSPVSSAIEWENSLDTPKSEVETFPEHGLNEKEIVSPTEDDERAISEDVPDVIPNGGYGWVCVGTCFTINAHTWGMNSVSLDLIRENCKDRSGNVSR
jgi:hypothetical protein